MVRFSGTDCEKIRNKTPRRLNEDRPDCGGCGVMRERAAAAAADDDDDAAHGRAAAAGGCSGSALPSVDLR